MVDRTSPGVRERMIASTALLMRERGARATSLDAVLAHSGAPRGSIYHHFPGGREQLLREATDFAGTVVADLLERHGAEDPVACLDWFVGMYTQVLRDSDFRAGCPVVAVAVETGGDGPDLSPNVREAFDRWLGVMQASCERAGIAPQRASDLALAFVAGAEGALILCRAYRDLAPLEAVARDLRERLRAEVAAAGHGRS